MRRNDTGFCVVCEEQGESDYVTLSLIAASLIAFLGLAVWILYRYRRSARYFDCSCRSPVAANVNPFIAVLSSKFALCLRVVCFVFIAQVLVAVVDTNAGVWRVFFDKAA